MYIHTFVALKHSCLSVFRCVVAVVSTKYHCRANHQPGFLDGELVFAWGMQATILIPIAGTVDECRCRKISYVIEYTLYTPER